MRSMRATLLVWYAAILAVVIAAFAASVFVLQDQAERRSIDAALETHALAVAGSIEWEDGEGFELELGGPYEGFFRQTGPDAPYLVVRAADGGVLVETPAAPASGAAPAARREVEAAGPFGTHIRVGRGTASLERARMERAITLLLAGLVAFLIAFLAGQLLVRRVLRPIDRMTKSASRISAANLKERIDVERTESELGQLATTLNGAFDRMEAAVDEQARFVADASHELRTPLATMEAASTWALRRDRDPDELREGIEILRRACARMQGIVDSMLALARTDADASRPAKDGVDLAGVAREAALSLTPRARAQGTRVELETRPAPTRGDAMWLERAVTAVLDNALRHGGPGGRVWVRTGHDEHAWLEVTDSGPGIGAGHLDRVFERFYRGDASRTAATGGSGLGLALTRSLVEAQGGSVRVQATGPDGTTFRIEMPFA